MAARVAFNASSTRCFFSFPIELSRALHELCRREGVTLFMALLSAFDVLLHRYTGQSDLLVGSPIAGRTHAETEGLIGFFVNTLVLRNAVSGEQTYRDHLHQVKETCLGAYAHQDMPFERLVQELAPDRDPGRSPLFQVAFNLQTAPQPPLALPGLEVLPLNRSHKRVNQHFSQLIGQFGVGFYSAFIPKCTKWFRGAYCYC
mgnify:CR=1 FL=1